MAAYFIVDIDARPRVGLQILDHAPPGADEIADSIPADPDHRDARAHLLPDLRRRPARGR